MYPPMPHNIDITAISSLLGSVSLACWIVVFSPQIIENFRRSSAEGLSIVFVMIWLTGDVFNVLGAVFQGVLPTMIILAVYYMLADIVLLSQCFYYKGFKFHDEVKKPSDSDASDGERRPLLSETNGTPSEDNARRHSRSSIREHILSLSEQGTHLSPANPLHGETSVSPAPTTRPVWQSVAMNITAIIVVCAAGVLGWWLSQQRSHRGKEPEKEPDDLHFNVAGQIFGYICASLYLSSRIPQLLLNYRRKSTDGISILFFLFASIGNLTYVLSIFAFDPVCENPGHCRPGEAKQIYGRYILVNTSWLLGSMGTFLLDMVALSQFVLYGDAPKRKDVP